jgi:Uma2 family endonuclease
MTAMSAGTQEFWIVNRDRGAVEVSRLDGVRHYGPGDSIPLTLFGGSLDVDDIFAYTASPALHNRYPMACFR